jgi:photosynthetic reaction center cytochrome c subunit
MKFIIIAAAVLTYGFAPQKPRMAEEVFKNVQVLKGIPVDEFMNTMGIFSAALGMSCEDCHASNDSSWENYALDASAKKQIARRMVVMMSAINKDYFGGRQVVTCYACHRGGYTPRITPNLATLYNMPDEPEDLVVQAPNAPSADEVFDKYLEAIGGAGRAGKITSIVARGISVGYGPEGNRRPVEVYAQAPDRRATIVRTLNGDSTTTHSEGAGWIAAPLRPVPVMDISGSALEGLKLEAELAFPARIKQALAKWRVGFPAIVDDRDVHVVQGTSPGGSLATLYFDMESGLLLRVVRFAASAVGRVPTQIDYSDYREAAGVKIPFRWIVTWLDGRETYEMSEVQVNVPIDAARFRRPHG